MLWQHIVPNGIHTVRTVIGYALWRNWCHFSSSDSCHSSRKNLIPFPIAFAPHLSKMFKTINSEFAWGFWNSINSKHSLAYSIYFNRLLCSGPLPHCPPLFWNITYLWFKQSSSELSSSLVNCRCFPVHFLAQVLPAGVQAAAETKNERKYSWHALNLLPYECVWHHWNRFRELPC